MRLFLACLLLGLAAVRPAAALDEQRAVFAGGCFWCVESDFDSVAGVLKTTSGYTGGTIDNPTYKLVSYTDTGHYEAVEIVYDAEIVSYPQLLSVFWRSVDPTDAGGQFCDRGDSYRTAVFATSPQQQAQAEASKAEHDAKLAASIVTPVLPASTFWPAEDYHQDYYLKNPLRYKFYRSRCGRDNRVKEVWGANAFDHETGS